MLGARPFLQDEAIRLSRSYRGRCGLRNRTMILLGVNTGFRISELLQLRLKDVVDPFGNLTDHVKVARKYMKKKKAGRTVPLTLAAKAALRPLILQMEFQQYFLDSDFLFRSDRTNSHITRQQAWRIIKEGCLKCHITGSISTHSLRKTFAKNVHDDFKQQVAAGNPVDVLLEVSKALGHTDINSTTKYLSFDRENLNQTLERIGIYG